MGKLTAKEVENANAGMHADGDGLYLQVTGHNARSWVFRFRFKGKEKYLGLGSASAITLKRARELADEARRLKAEGKNPIEHRREREASARAEASRSQTFWQCAEQFIASHEKGWCNDKHRQQWTNTLTTYAKPVLGNLLVQDISTAHVMKVLAPIWSTKPETASRVRGRIEQILDAAKTMGLRDGENPARWRGHISNLLPTKTKVRAVRHHAALPYKEIPSFMAELRTRPSISARALEFVILTVMRSDKETLQARWNEIDIAAGIWTCPAERMKMKKEHRVPLSARAKEVLQSLPRHDQAGNNEWLFPGHKGRLTGAALSKMLELLKRDDVTVHGFRSTFRDWAAETTAYPNHVVEMCLAHAIGDAVEAAYRRGDLFEKRCRLMEEWARYCTEAPARAVDNVMALRPIGAAL